LAIPVIVVGNHQLVPDTPGQQIPINVTGGDSVYGVNFYIQVADGGPEAGGSIDGPILQDLDIITGTIFEPDNTGEYDQDGPGSPDAVPQWEGHETTVTGLTPVSADGLLGTVTIDTTGFTNGSWALKMSDTVNGPASFSVTPISITDGRINVGQIPEPATLLLLVLGAAGLAWWRRLARKR